MKKNYLLTLTAACLMALSLTACGDNNNNSADNAGEAETETAVADENGNAANDVVDPADIDPDKYITKLGDYKGITIAATKRAVTDNDVETKINSIISNATVNTEITDRTDVQEGDVANIDFEGKKDGVAFDGGTSQGYDLEIGSGSFIPGFEEGLIGVNVGETVDLDLTFPETYGNAELAGQAVVFTVKVNSISAKTIPELNDEYVAGLGIENVSNVDEYREYIRKNLEESAEESYIDALKSSAIDTVVASTEFAEDYPTDLFDYYFNLTKSNDQYYAQYYGFEFSEYINLAYGAESEEAYDEIIKESALKFVHETMTCNKIALLENITVSDEQYRENLEKDAASVGYSAEEYEKNINVDQYKFYILENLVIDFVVDNANVTEAAAEE